MIRIAVLGSVDSTTRTLSWQSHGGKKYYSWFSFVEYTLLLMKYQKHKNSRRTVQYGLLPIASDWEGTNRNVIFISVATPGWQVP